MIGGYFSAATALEQVVSTWRGGGGGSPQQMALDKGGGGSGHLHLEPPCELLPLSAERKELGGRERVPLFGEKDRHPPPSSNTQAGTPEEGSW